MRYVTLLLLTVPLFATPSYTVTNLGGFGGGVSIATAINNKAQTAGSAVTLSGTQLAFSALSSASMLASSATADDINNRGAVVGTAFGSTGPRATVWQNGIANAILDQDSFGLGLNDSGDVVGSVIHGLRTSAFISSGGQLTEIQTPGYWSVAYDVNASKTVVGTYASLTGNFGAFSWTAAGGTKSLGTLGGWSSYAQAVNDNGQVVGSSLTNSSQLHAFLSDGQMRDLGTLGGSLSAAYDINNAGQVVGYSLNGHGDSSAFLWMNGVMFDLNQLIGPAQGWTLDAAYGINSLGQIVGTGTYMGEAAAFRLDPASVPEPATIGLAGVALLLLAGARRRRRQ